MLTSTYLTIDIDKINSSFEINLPENVFICFRMHQFVKEQLTSFLREIYTFSFKSSFCVSINSVDLSPDTIELLAEYLLPITVHYRYLNSTFSTPVVVVNSAIAVKPVAAGLLVKIFQEQGYNSIDFVHAGSKQNSLLDFDDLAQKMQSNYSDASALIAPLSNSVFINLDSVEQIPIVIKALDEYESRISEKYPRLIELLQDYNKTKNAEKGLAIQVGVLTKKLESAQNYNSVDHKSNSEYERRMTEMVEFYTKEYEILPAWYKKLGHIIKVMTGKRTFKSLFNDNVKKYKE